MKRRRGVWTPLKDKIWLDIKDLGPTTPLEEVWKRIVIKHMLPGSLTWRLSFACACASLWLGLGNSISIYCMKAPIELVGMPTERAKHVALCERGRKWHTALMGQVYSTSWVKEWGTTCAWATQCSAAHWARGALATLFHQQDPTVEFWDKPWRSMYWQLQWQVWYCEMSFGNMARWTIRCDQHMKLVLCACHFHSIKVQTCHDHGHVFLSFFPLPFVTCSMTHSPWCIISIVPSLHIPDGYTLLGLKAVWWLHLAS